MRDKSPAARGRSRSLADKPELVVITGLSGSGKGSVLKALEIGRASCRERVYGLV